MEIIGVSHVEEYVEQIDKYLEKSYPRGIRSLLVELPPPPLDLVNAVKLEFSEDEVSYVDGFFSTIASRHMAKGTKIIYGDINRQLLEVDFLNFYNRTLEEMFGTHRDDGIRQVFEQEQPEVTLLGTSHAGKLKRAFPEIPFTRFYDNDPSWEVPNWFTTQGIPTPDKIICFD
ncbi:MAG TPA: hypothetical protein ENH99_01790 [Candidatus Pacearchaeota archaeon]|nr:hypothetical protein [Candidatus Pacearchaeota archaeon]